MQTQISTIGFLNLDMNVYIDKFQGKQATHFPEFVLACLLPLNMTHDVLTWIKLK